ncbi:hypothetical protein E3E35_02675 [Thermococcus sp. GR7]|uniref:hypothetical protein n=1 Tax=unclassified Thermococcus TaxID=2627626 RepID=UPI00142FAB60|nr:MULTISPECIES: hypothetical protein [unclassified Thermococcus]NJE46334.1 hypothetical protein [Thermococcus sp. GR7]NJE77747.1 hypothetical protein [Thermococcus sp. GR4]NJF23787.1 hypothetical protein [Thermococcus sp. GR5]
MPISTNGLIRTLNSWKFWAVLLLAILVTYVLFFPIFKPLMEDYSELKSFEMQMVKEHDAMVCHQIYSMNSGIFERINATCDNEYYRPNISTTTYKGLVVYRDTYEKFQDARRRTLDDLHKVIPLLPLLAVLMLYFNYVLVDTEYLLMKGTEPALRDALLKGLNSIPGLIIAELTTLLAVFLIGVILAVSLAAIFGELGIMLVAFMIMPALSLVTPTYHFTRLVIPIEEILRTAKRCPGGYTVLGLLIMIVGWLFEAAYTHYLGIWSAAILALLGLVKYMLDSLAALVVYLGGTEEEKTG